MKNKIWLIGLVFLVSICLVSAADWTPYGYTNINLRDTHNITNVPYINGTTINVTTYYGDGSQLTGITGVNGNTTEEMQDAVGAMAGSNLTYTDGSDDLSVNVAGLKTYFDTLYLAIASAFSGVYADLTGKPTLLSNFTDDLSDRGYTDLVNFTNSPGYITNSTMNKSVAWTDIADPTYDNCSSDQSCDTILYTTDLPLANKTTPYCGNISGAVSDLCTLTSAGADFTNLAYTNISETFEKNITMSGGSLLITNPNNYNAIKIDQNGDTGDDPSTGGAINIDNTDNNGSALVIYTNQGVDRQDALMLIKVDNTSYDGPILRIISDSADSEGTIRLDSPNPEIEFVDTSFSGYSGKFELRNNNNRMQINSRASSDSTFEKLWSIGQLAEGGNVQLANPSQDIGRFVNENYSRYSIFNKSQHTTNFFSIFTGTTPNNSAGGTGVPWGDIFNVEGDGDICIGCFESTIYKLTVNSTDDSRILLQTTGSSDPSIIFNTTNSPNKVTLYLDESETNNHLIVDGTNMSIDTYFDIKATDGEGSLLTLYSGANKGEITYSSGDIFRMINQKENADIRFNIDDGGVSRDLLSLDASTSQVGIYDTSPSYTLDVNGTLGVRGNISVQGNSIENTSFSTFCNGVNCWKMYVNASDYFIIEEV